MSEERTDRNFTEVYYQVESIPVAETSANPDPLAHPKMRVVTRAIRSLKVTPVVRRWFDFGARYLLGFNYGH